MEKKGEGTGIHVPEHVKVKSLYKAIQLLFYFTEEERELGITEIAEKSGLLKSSVHNMLSTYEACGLVRRNPYTNKYHLGERVLELSNHFYRNNDVRQVAKPYMVEIANETNESVFLAVSSGTEVIYLDGAFPDTSVGGRNMTGLKAPKYCTGIGKVILAHEPEACVDAVIEEGMVAFTEQTITDGETLRTELENIREKGCAVDNMEHEYGVKCVAVPIYNMENRVVAAISITGPSPRFTQDRIEELEALLKEYAQVLKCRL